MHELIRDITFSIAAAWLLGLVAQHFRQPILLAYLVGGFALGPVGLGLIESGREHLCDRGAGADLPSLHDRPRDRSEEDRQRRENRSP